MSGAEIVWIATIIVVYFAVTLTAAEIVECNRNRRALRSRRKRVRLADHRPNPNTPTTSLTLPPTAPLTRSSDIWGSR